VALLQFAVAAISFQGTFNFNYGIANLATVGITIPVNLEGGSAVTNVGPAGGLYSTQGDFNSQSFGFVACPRKPHAPPGHCEKTVHAAPLFVPPMHRFPPQTVPAPVQSAFVKQGSAARSLQVSQIHFRFANPAALQFGFAAVKVRVCVPVEFVRLIGSVATTASGFGGQSRLVPPQNGFGDLPFTSHVWPAFGPASHVPARMPSFAGPSPAHFGHGFGFGPVATREMSCTLDAAVPVSTSAVPVIGPLI